MWKCSQIVKRVSLVWLCILAVVVPAAGTETQKPVLIISVAGYQKLVDDLGQLGQWGARPELGTALEGIVSLATGGKGLLGLDKTRPVSLVIQTDGRQFIPYLLLPVTDLEKFLSVVEPLLTNPITKKDGIYEVSFERGRKLFLQTRGQQWAVAAETQEALASVPQQISEDLQQKLPEPWTVGISLLTKNIAPEQRRQWAERLRSQAQRELIPRPGETEEDFKVRKWLSEWLADWLASLLDQVETLQIGLGVDNQAEALVAEMALQPVAGSALADAIQQAGQTKTAFAGLLMADATLSGHGVLRYPAGEFHQIAPLVEMLKVRAIQQRPRPDQTPEQAQLQRELRAAIFDLVEKTLKSGRIEGALSVVLQPDQFTLLAGLYVADGKAVEKLIERAVAEARKVRPVEVDQYVKLRAEQFHGVNLHVVRFPLPPEAERRDALLKLIGPEVELVLGTGPESLYMALGKSAESTLRQAIQKDAQGAQPVAPMAAGLAIKPLLAMLAEHGQPDQKEKARQWMEKISGKDRLQLALESCQGRLRLRLQIQRDVLAVLADAVEGSR